MGTASYIPRQAIASFRNKYKVKFCLKVVSHCVILNRYSPLEAGLVRSVHFQKGCFVGNEVIAKTVLTNSIRQKLSVLEIKSSGKFIHLLIDD